MGTLFQTTQTRGPRVLKKGQKCHQSIKQSTMTHQRTVSQSPHSVTNISRSPKIKIAATKTEDVELAHYEREAAVKDYLVLQRIMQRRSETGNLIPPSPSFPTLTSVSYPPLERPEATTRQVPDPPVDADDDDMVFDLEL